MPIQKPARDLIKALVPPIVPMTVRRIEKTAGFKPKLFDGDSAAFERYVSKAKIYGEYGVGQSTDFVASRLTTPVMAVDTSKAWIDTVRERNRSSQTLDLRWVDVGPIGDWGRPTGFSKRNNFFSYISSIWDRENRPDTILVDGRFRVSCFLYSASKADAGSVIIFDDYADRPGYHVVEEFIRPIETCGRQAIFSVPEGLDRDACEREARRFGYVID